MSRRVLTGPERVAAAVVTGPVAHLVAGVLDWLELIGRLLWARVRRGR